MSYPALDKTPRQGDKYFAYHYPSIDVYPVKRANKKRGFGVDSILGHFYDNDLYCKDLVVLVRVRKTRMSDVMSVAADIPNYVRFSQKELTCEDQEGLNKYTETPATTTIYTYEYILVSDYKTGLLFNNNPIEDAIKSFLSSIHQANDEGRDSRSNHLTQPLEVALTPNEICGFFDYLIRHNPVDLKKTQRTFPYLNKYPTGIEIHVPMLKTADAACNYYQTTAIGKDIPTLSIEHVVGSKVLRNFYTERYYNLMKNHIWIYHREMPNINEMTYRDISSVYFCESFFRFVNLMNANNPETCRYRFYMQNNKLWVDTYMKKEVHAYYFNPKGDLHLDTQLILPMLQVEKIDENYLMFDKTHFVYNQGAYHPVLANNVTPLSLPGLTMTPFSYQARNIQWMAQVEAHVRTTGGYRLTLPYVKLSPELYTPNYIRKCTVNGKIYHNIHFREYMHNFVEDIHKYDMTLTITGGLVCDDVGLGKTLCVAGHLLHQRAVDTAWDDNNSPLWDLNTCIIVPARLLQQWKYELDTYYRPGGPTYVTLGSITDIKKLFKRDTVTGELHMPVKYDIYIVSVNLLNNKNYMTYLKENVQKDENFGSSKEYMTSYFDLFQIRWNRLICDEAHEFFKHNDSYKEQRCITKRLTYNIRANYRWGLTATPFEQLDSNAIAYMQWLAAEFKKQTTEVQTGSSLAHTVQTETGLSREAYIDKCIDNVDDIEPPVKINNFIPISTYIEFQKACLTKTTKASVSGEINIPIFTEEIREIELSPIERNIYNNARAQVTENSRIDKMRRLFQLCTNICISDVDAQELGLGEGTMSLDDLNKAMIGTFKRQLKTVMTDLEQTRATSPDFKSKLEVSKKIKEYIETVADPDIKNRITTHYGRQLLCFVHACNLNRREYEGVSVTDEEIRLWTHIKTTVYDRLLECERVLDNIFIIVNEVMATTPANIPKPDWNDEKIISLVYLLIIGLGNKTGTQCKESQEAIEKLEREVVRLNNQIKLFESNDFLKEKTADPCIICWTDYMEDSQVVVTDCRHIFCGACFQSMAGTRGVMSCPECRADIHVKKVKMTQMKCLQGNPEPEEAPTVPVAPAAPADWTVECGAKYGSKMVALIAYLKMLIEDTEHNNRMIVFSQYDNMLKLIGKTLAEYKISHVHCKGNVYVINKNIDKFKRDNSIRVIMLSSEHSNSGSNLTEASHIILVDVLNMGPTQTREVETQAIGRAVRLGQKKPVKIVRLITKNTVESDTYEKNKYNMTE